MFAPDFPSKLILNWLKLLELTCSRRGTSTSLQDAVPVSLLRKTSRI